jgi:hypothetical protein
MNNERLLFGCADKPTRRGVHEDLNKYKARGKYDQ